jgi:hypothetical protein
MKAVTNGTPNDKLVMDRTMETIQNPNILLKFDTSEFRLKIGRK